MGLLATGTPLEWPEAKTRADHVRKWGIEQLLAIWRRAKGKERDVLLWGDEIEYLVVAFEEEQRKVKLSLRQADILDALAKDEALCKQGGCVPDLQLVAHNGDPLPVFHPEFGRFMLEATPGKPWGIGLKDLLDVEPNMKWRFVTLSVWCEEQIDRTVQAENRPRSHGVKRIPDNFDHIPSLGHQRRFYHAVLPSIRRTTAIAVPAGPDREPPYSLPYTGSQH